MGDQHKGPDIPNPPRLFTAGRAGNQPSTDLKRRRWARREEASHPMPELLSEAQQRVLDKLQGTDIMRTENLNV